MDNSIKKCINCGREMSVESNFCQYCGAKQPSNQLNNQSNNAESFMKLKMNKQHYLHLLIWTYFMVLIAFGVFLMIGGMTHNLYFGEIITYLGTGVAGILAIVMDCKTIKWYKISSIISIILNGSWLLYDIYLFKLLLG